MIDYHMHTDHSGDGKTPLSAMIEGAIQNGLLEICITSHFDALFPFWVGETHEPDLMRYYQDIAAAAQAYAGRIKIKAGVEAGLMAWREDVRARTEEAIAGVPFDFIIGSLHCLSPQWVKDEGEYWRGHSRESFVRMVTEHLLAIATDYDCFDVMGHVTYFSRYCPLEDKRQRYTDAPEGWDALFQALIARGKGIEINASAYGNLGFFLPDLDLVRRYRELGGEIVTIGSDAHIPADIGRHGREARAMLREAGFRYQCTYTRRTPSFEKL